MALLSAGVQLILASASPARLDTLRRAGLDPHVVVSGVDEPAVLAGLGPLPVAELTVALAGAKARDVAHRLAAGHRGAASEPDGAQPGADRELIVLGCDSLLELDGVAYGKPGDAQSVYARWRELQGRTATLHTGHALIRVDAAGGRREQRAVGSAQVRFGSPTERELAAYIGSGEPQQVAGAFTIDGLGSWFVRGVDGDPHTVIGVSLPLLRTMLADFGVELTDLGWPAGRD